MIVPSWRTRPAPSGPRRPLLHRPRLAEVVAGRWGRRLTAIVAGAGFGKSALLVESLEANRREPMGHDAWVGCQEEDVRLDRLFEAIFAAVRDEGPHEWPVDVDDAVNRIADAVWSHAPVPVAIVLDDVHHLGADSPGADLLDALVRRLPANAHFVLTSRTVLPVSLARLLSAGDAVLLDEADLVMTPSELEELADQRERPGLDLTATGGWPALAALSVHAGEARSPDLGDYLADELLRDLPKSQVAALAVLGAVGPLHEQALVEIVGDRDLDVAALTRLPLVDVAGGVIEAHSLWNAAGTSSFGIDPEWLRDATRAGAEAVRAAGNAERAFRLAVAIGDDELALTALGDLCRESIHTSTGIDVGSCVDDLPDALRDAPEARLAAALATGPGGWDTNRDQLIEASLALEELGASSLQVVALTRLGVMGWHAGDLSVAGHLLPRIERLAGSGDPQAAAVAALGNAVMADITGDRDALWASLDEFDTLHVEEPLRTIGARFRASMELHHGSAADALDLIVEMEATAPPSLRPELLALAVWASWLVGDERGAKRWAGQMQAEEGDLTQVDLAQVMVVRSNVALLDAWSVTGPATSATGASGDGSGSGAASDVATLLDDAATCRGSGLLVSSFVLAMAAATRLVAAGDEDEARRVLVEAFSAPDTVWIRLRSAVIRGLALVWVLLPEHRDELAPLEIGTDTGTAAALEAARVLCDSRAASAKDRSWCDRAEAVLADPAVATRLPAPWLAELAARFAGPKASDERLAVAHDAVDRLGPVAAPALRRLSTIGSDKAVVAGVTAILSSRTPVSEGRFVLRLLGPMTIERDGVEVEEPDWRRDRVRALFALIARRGTISRRAAADVLWPDLEVEAQANNLRVTLSYLQKVLEPDRTRHEVAYHVRGDGASLRFAGRPSWTIDVEEMEVALDTAEADDRRGASALALDGYLAAIEWHRGPFLADVELDASDEIEQDRLRSRYVRALIRAGGLLVAVDRTEEAQRLAGAAQAADPWSDEALCLQTECYLAKGDRAAALRSHKRAVALTEELNLPPSETLTRLGRTLGPHVP